MPSPQVGLLNMDHFKKQRHRVVDDFSQIDLSISIEAASVQFYLHSNKTLSIAFHKEQNLVYTCRLNLVRLVD